MKADFQQYQFWHPALRTLVLWIEKETGVEFTSTSMFRMGDGGVHGQLPLRGVDLRIRLKTMGIAIQRHININWQYDHARPHLKSAVLHGEGANLHLHLQVHNNTKRVIL